MAAAFAKLSASLLGWRDGPPARRRTLATRTAASAPAATPATDQARLLARHLEALNLPTFAREHDTLARQCLDQGVDHIAYLRRLAEVEVNERSRRKAEQLIRRAQFPAMKSLDSFDFAAMPALDKDTVRELARCEYVARRESVVIVGNSGTGKTHIALGLGLAGCRHGFPVGFTTAAALVQGLVEAHADRQRQSRLQRRLDACKLLIIDELGYVPLSRAGAELLVEVVSRRCHRASTMITSNLAAGEWSHIFGSERLAGALLDRLDPCAHTLLLFGDNYRRKHGGAGQHDLPRHHRGGSRRRRASPGLPTTALPPVVFGDARPAP